MFCLLRHSNSTSLVVCVTIQFRTSLGAFAVDDVTPTVGGPLALNTFSRHSWSVSTEQDVVLGFTGEKRRDQCNECQKD